MFFCRPRQNPRYLNVNEILDLLDDDETHNVEAIYISPPDGDVSDGYDESDTEDANPDCLSKAVLTSRVLEVQSRGEPLLEEEVGNPEEEGEEDVQTSGAEKRARVARDEWKWEKKTTSFNSRQPPLSQMATILHIRICLPKILWISSSQMKCWKLLLLAPMLIGEHSMEVSLQTLQYLN